MQYIQIVLLWQTLLVGLVDSECPVPPPTGCSICGDGKCVGNPAGVAVLPGQPNYPCGLLEQGGYTGQVPLDQCPLIAPLIPACECGTGSTSPPTSKPTAAPKPSTRPNPPTQAPVSSSPVDDSPIVISPIADPPTSTSAPDASTRAPAADSPVVVDSPIAEAPEADPPIVDSPIPAPVLEPTITSDPVTSTTEPTISPAAPFEPNPTDDDQDLPPLMKGMEGKKNMPKGKMTNADHKNGKEMVGKNKMEKQNSGKANLGKMIMENAKSGKSNNMVTKNPTSTTRSATTKNPTVEATSMMMTPTSMTTMSPKMTKPSSFMDTKVSKNKL